MEDEMYQLEDILSNLPAKPDRSRLDRHANLIAELLGRGWTYRAVARILAERCDVHASISTIHHFVHRRRKAKRNLRKREPSAINAGEDMNRSAEPEANKVIYVEKKDAEDAVYQRIAALKQQPASDRNAVNLFHYDPNKPLQLPQKPQLTDSKE